MNELTTLGQTPLLTITPDQDTPDRDEEGLFLPGNQYWSLNAFKKGCSADRPNKWTPDQLRTIMADYLETRLDDGKPITKAGLRLALGISREALNNYSKGEYGKSEEDKRAYVDLFSLFDTVIEAELEQELRRDKGQVNGIIFALKNQFSGNWKDEKHLSLESHELQVIRIISDPGGALAKRLMDEGQLIEYVTEPTTNTGEEDDIEGKAYAHSGRP